MANAREGSIRLFHFAGVDVFLHWSWFLVAIYEIQSRNTRYSSIGWNIAEYLALFLIVTLHEFGHAMACRQVGGTANQIVLWPLGGVAYVDPPPRPGATLWSIAAGPLVNVALLPILFGAYALGRTSGWPLAMPDLYRLVTIASGYRYRAAGVQHAPHLSTGRRSDSAIAALVRYRASAQSDGGRQPWFRGSGWVHRPGGLAALHLVWRDSLFHADELLGRAATCAWAAAARKIAAPGRFQVPELPNGASAGKLLEVRRSAGNHSTHFRAGQAAPVAGHNMPIPSAWTAGRRIPCMRGRAQRWSGGA